MLWALAIVGLVVSVWLDQLLRQTDRPELVVLIPSAIAPVLGTLSTATVGRWWPAERRPAQPVGWLLLAFGLSLSTAGSLPSARWSWLARVTAATPVALLLVAAMGQPGGGGPAGRAAA